MISTVTNDLDGLRAYVRAMIGHQTQRDFAKARGSDSGASKPDA